MLAWTVSTPQVLCPKSWNTKKAECALAAGLDKMQCLTFGCGHAELNKPSNKNKKANVGNIWATRATTHRAVQVR